MRRLVSTADGSSVFLHLWLHDDGALAAEVAMFPAEGAPRWNDTWASAEGATVGPYEGWEQYLGEFVADVTDIDRAEAHRIAYDTLRDWRRRGGYEQRPTRRGPPC